MDEKSVNFNVDKNELAIFAAKRPLIVPFSKSETIQEFRMRWSKVDTISDRKKEILSSDVTVEKIEDIAKRFRLTYEEICDISRLVRYIVFGEMNISSIDVYLEQKIQHIAQADRENVRNVIVEILSQQPSQKLEEKKKTINMPLAQALSQYPKIGEQIIGSNQIKIRAFSVPVRASIKNWIVDFHDAMGSGKHSPIDRGNFLFHSENGKKLTPPERQKIALILKSLEDGTPLTIDVDSQSVVFENAGEPNVNNQPRPVEQKTYPQSPAKEERVENFFQIPESKPPIGSDEFHIEIPENEILNDREMGNDYSEKSNDESLLKKLREKSFGFMKGDSSATDNENTAKEIQSAKNDFSPNFAANDGKISFSSAQKFPVEQGTASDYSISQVTQTQQQTSPQQAKKVFETEQIPQIKKPTQAPISPYRITPSSYAQQRNGVEPKVQGNVVDLKN